VTDYTYDDANRMTSAGGITYSWDNNGNLLNDGTNTYTYNHFNKLTMVDGQSSIVSFTYNGLGDRLSETINGVTTIFTLDLNTGLTQVLADNTHVYLYGLGRISQGSGSESVYFLGDALGSVRQLADGQGTVILARAYEPYGSVLSTAGEDATKYGFTGEWQENGLVFLKTRFYYSNIGRFLSRDDWIGESRKPLTLNKWGYVIANPILLTDPNGNIPCKQLAWWQNSSECLLLAGDLHDLAARINEQVFLGSLLPVEGLAQLVDHAYFESEKNYWGMMWSLTAVIDGYDGNNIIPVWLQGANSKYNPGTTTSYFIGEDWLPYRGNPEKDDDNWENTGSRWRYSERGDWRQDLWDQTANQAFHFWFSTAVTYFNGDIFAYAGNLRHEVWSPNDYFGNMHDYSKNPPDQYDPPPWHGQSKPDYDLALVGIALGNEIKHRENNARLYEKATCREYLPRESWVGDWIRYHLK